MTKVVALLVTVVCCWPCASYLHGDVPKATIASQVVDYATRVERMPWTWSDHRASLTESIGRHLFDDEVEILSQDSGYRFAIRLKHAGQVIYAFTGHEETVFARWGDRLYLADFSPRASGCTVLAVNLKTGERLWENRLRAWARSTTRSTATASTSQRTARPSRCGGMRHLAGTSNSSTSGREGR